MKQDCREIRKTYSKSKAGFCTLPVLCHHSFGAQAPLRQPPGTCRSPEPAAGQAVAHVPLPPPWRCSTAASSLSHRSQLPRRSPVARGRPRARCKSPGHAGRSPLGKWSSPLPLLLPFALLPEIAPLQESSEGLKSRTCYRGGS